MLRVGSRKPIEIEENSSVPEEARRRTLISRKKSKTHIRKTMWVSFHPKWGPPPIPLLSGRNYFHYRMVFVLYMSFQLSMQTKDHFAHTLLSGQSYSISIIVRFHMNFRFSMRSKVQLSTPYCEIILPLSIPFFY